MPVADGEAKPLLHGPPQYNFLGIVVIEGKGIIRLRTQVLDLAWDIREVAVAHLCRPVWRRTVDCAEKGVEIIMQSSERKEAWTARRAAVLSAEMWLSVVCFIPAVVVAMEFLAVHTTLRA